MTVIHGYECDFCGVCTTHGCYCSSCFQLIIDEYTEALAAFEEEENESIG